MLKYHGPYSDLGKEKSAAVLNFLPALLVKKCNSSNQSESSFLFLMLPLDFTVTVWPLSSPAFVVSLRDRLHCVMQNWAGTTEAESPCGLDDSASAPHGAGMAMMLPGSIPGFCMMLRGMLHRLTQILSARIWRCLLKAVAASLFQQGYPLWCLRSLSCGTTVATRLWTFVPFITSNLLRPHPPFYLQRTLVLGWIPQSQHCTLQGGYTLKVWVSQALGGGWLVLPHSMALNISTYRYWYEFPARLVLRHLSSHSHFKLKDKKLLITEQGGSG